MSFKDSKFAKIAGKVLAGVSDLLPGGRTIYDIGEGLINKKFDRNNDGKVSIEDFKPVELITIFGGLLLLSVLASKGFIDIEVLKQIAGIFGFGG